MALARTAVATLRAAGIDEPTLEALRRHLVLVELVEPVESAVADRLSASGLSSLGAQHQRLLEAEHRHRHGVHYTPWDVAVAVVGRALAMPRATVATVPVVCDPSCGGGVFLLAAAENMVAGGADPSEAAGAVHGLDLDPLAVDVARTSMVIWAAARGICGDDLVELAAGVVARVVVGDALRGPWPGEGRLELVVGNPPFAGQLASSTARDNAASEAARALLDGAAPGYADTAGLFVVKAALAALPGARIAMLQPISVLGSRHAGVVRRRLEELTVLDEVWLGDERIFEAAVAVCAPFLRVIDPWARAADAVDADSSVMVSRGRDLTVVGAVPRTRFARAGTWAPVVAAATGVPLLDLDDRTRLGSRVRATAGFRDEFYALVPYVTDLDHRAETVGAETDEAAADSRVSRRVPGLPSGSARLITAGLVEPARVLWGTRATRFAGRRLLAPAVDVARLRRDASAAGADRRLSAWADARLRPKVVVATQTRTVEAAVDDDGTWWPSVPVISVVCDPEGDDTTERWLVAAALMAPPVTAWAAERSAGTALSAHAIKLSARQVLEIPLPVDADAWAEGAAHLRAVPDAADGSERDVLLAAAGRALTAAHHLPAGLGAHVLAWWADRVGCAEHI